MARLTTWSTMANRIHLSIQDIIDIDVESEELSFSELKKEAISLFRYVKKNVVNTKPYSDEVA